jgi:hypothetical protein
MSPVQRQVAGLFVVEERGCHQLKGVPKPRRCNQNCAGFRQSLHPCGVGHVAVDLARSAPRARFQGRWLSAMDLAMSSATPPTALTATEAHRNLPVGAHTNL